MILNIFGGGGSGKTTLQQVLLGQSGFVNIVPFTTRARRIGEQDGVHYNFVTKKVFADTNLVLERFVDGSMYGVARQDILSAGTVITTFDLNGIGGLEKLEVVAKIVFLDIPEIERISRMLKRGDDREVVMRRIKTDRERIHYPNTIYPVLRIGCGSVRQILRQVLNFVK